MRFSPHQMEQLRAEPSRSARNIQYIIAHIRPALTALLLARLSLKILITVVTTVALINSTPVRGALHTLALQLGIPAVLVWGIAGLLFASLLAILFWSLQKIRWPYKNGTAPSYALKRLSWFILLCMLVFRPLQSKASRADEPSPASPAPSNTSSGFNGAPLQNLELLKSIVKFSDVTVKQVMQPRSKVMAVDFRTRFPELLAIVHEAGFSRLPVYDEDLDNVTGILYIKDLVPHLDKPDDFEWQSLIRTNLQLVPEAKRISELLQEFKRNKRHMAIVVDEYGGSSGIVTMEDILEEITGEIRDEFDEESDIRYRKLDDHNYLFEGQTLLNDVCRIAGLPAGTFDEIRGAADSLAGLALELRGDIPKPGTELAWNGYLLTVIAADDRRIEQLKLTLTR